MSQLPLTQHEQEVLDLFLELGDKQAVANRLGCSRATVRTAILRIERKGHAPWMTPVGLPDHMAMSKTTVQYNSAGVAIQEWKRMNPTAEMMQDFVDALCEQIRGKAKVPKRKDRKTDTENILGELAIYDPHVGMYSDEKETLDRNYDCEIAAKCMVASSGGILSRFTRPHKMVVTLGGDILHSDTRNNQTEASKHVLDVDTRYTRVVKYARAACQDVIRMAAEVAGEVYVVVVRGNHDWHSAVWLAELLDAYFHECPHINVCLSEPEVKHMVFGQNLLTWAHGDKIAPSKWGQLIPAMFAKEWGQTTFRHHKMGHRHNRKSIPPYTIDEQSGLLAEYMEALCPNDAWATGAGFFGSQRGASGYEYHRKGALVTRYFEPV